MNQTMLLVGMVVGLIVTGVSTYFASLWLDKMEFDIRVKGHYKKDLFVRAFITFLLLAVIVMYLFIVILVVL